jgi:hypothetical protein
MVLGAMKHAPEKKVLEGALLFNDAAVFARDGGRTRPEDRSSFRCRCCAK